MKLIEKPTKFIEEVGQEMGKVSWPTYEDLKSSTVVVIGLSLIFVVYVFSADWLLGKILRLIF